MKSSQFKIPPEQMQHMLEQMQGLLEAIQADVQDQEQRFNLVRAGNALKHLQAQLAEHEDYVDVAEVLLDWLLAVQPPKDQFADDWDDPDALGTALRIYAMDHAFFTEGLLERVDWAYVALQFKQTVSDQEGST